MHITKKMKKKFPPYWIYVILKIKRRKKMEKLTVFHVARYIVEHCSDMSFMKLEKLTYYCQAWSLVWDDVPLFQEDFQAWANGPVCPQLFKKHQGLFTVTKDFLKNYSGYPFSDEQKETMNAVLNAYGDEEPYVLSERTHQEAPWKGARKGVPVGERCHNVISKESMRDYYSESGEGWIE